MSNTVDCIEHLQAAVGELTGRGTDPICIIAALGEIAVQVVARDTPYDAAVQLESLAVVLQAQAQGLRAQAERERARG